MSHKVGRNDPCPCGSGKKYKSCCLQKESLSSKARSHKLTAKWLNAPQGPNLMERMFGEAISSTGKEFVPPPVKEAKQEEKKTENGE